MKLSQSLHFRLHFLHICITIDNTNRQRGEHMILQIDMSSDTPIYQQIRDQIGFGVATGKLQVGENLPTVRQLAADIGVNPMTVNKAYTLLKDEGIIVIDRRHGATINQIKIRENALDEDFNKRATILIADARLKGASQAKLKSYLQNLIDSIYQSEGEKHGFDIN